MTRDISIIRSSENPVPVESAVAGTQRPRDNFDRLFIPMLFGIGGFYVLLILALLLSDILFITPGDLIRALQSPAIRASIRLSLFSCSLATLGSLLVSIPTAYVMSRFSFRGKTLVDATLDVPIVLPPLVVGLSLLILFQTRPGQTMEQGWKLLFGPNAGITYHAAAVVLAQFTVGCALAVRSLRATFELIDQRQENMALTLGCSRVQAFRLVVIPQAGRGILAAGTLAWARSLGEFGPVLVFAGATRMKTEVLPTTVFLELSIGNIESAVAVSLVMVVVALGSLIAVRCWGIRRQQLRSDLAVGLP